MSSLQPLYDVKERLEAAAIAGTGLLGEDFRLRRAAENMAPLAAASPVFGKISAGLDKLLNAPAEERAGLLLDILALVDAVAYTQGKSGMDGEMTPLPTGGGTYIQLSYSQLKPLRTALTSTGGGRAAVIRTAWEDSPEIFPDYRIFPALISGLGDSSGEVADQAAEILRQMGPPVIPLLKADFDPKGRRAMARRVEVIDAVAGDGEREWYHAMLEQAGKDVRAPLIYTLRHSDGNFPQLKSFCQREKGACQEKAVLAVVCLTSAEAVAYTRELAKKKPDTVIQALGKSSQPAHSDLIAELLGRKMDQIFNAAPPNWFTRLWQGMDELISACLGKDSPAMLSLFRELAAWYDGDRSRWKSDGAVFQTRRNISCLFPFLGKTADWPLPAGLLSASVWREPTPALKALAGELAEQYGGLYYQPAVIAAGLTESSAAVWERFASLLLEEDDGNRRLGILSGLGLLTGRERGDRFLDSRWADTLTRLPPPPVRDAIPIWRAVSYRSLSWNFTVGTLELALSALDTGDAVCVKALRENLGKMPPQPGVSVEYLLNALQARDWWDWRGMLPALFRAAGERVSLLDLERYYRDVIGGHMTNGEKIAELEWFGEEIRSKRMKTFVTWSEDRLQQMMESLRQ